VPAGGTGGNCHARCAGRRAARHAAAVVAAQRHRRALPEVLASPGTVFGKALSMIADGELPTAIAVSGRGWCSVRDRRPRSAPRWHWSPACCGSARTWSTRPSACSARCLGRADPAVHHLFGINEEPKIALIALGVTFPIYFNLYAGIRGVDAQLVEPDGYSGWAAGAGPARGAARCAAGGTGRAALRAGHRVAALVWAEQVNASQGHRHLMNNAQQFFQTDVIGGLPGHLRRARLLCDLIVRLATKYLLSWRASFEGT